MRTKDAYKQQAIRDAVVHVVIRSGTSSASIARIAQQAEVSVGAVYLYYPNKEILLQEVYLEIKREFHAAAMHDIHATSHPVERLRAMWFALYKHIVTHMQDFLFTEYMAATHFLDDTHRKQIENLSADMVAVVQAAVDAGYLQNLPMSTLRAVLLAPLIHLAKQSADHGQGLPSEQVSQAYECIWQAVASR